MSDIHNPPPGAREWLGQVIVGAVSRPGVGDARAYFLLGAIEAHATLSDEDKLKIARWLHPDLFDAEGNRKS